MDAAPPILAPHAALRGMTFEQLDALVAEAGEKPFRARQLHQWVFRRHADSYDEMANLPARLRAWLAGRADVRALEFVRATGAEAGTRKILFRTVDDRYIESVIMRDEGDGRTSLCVSSQVGCAMACDFCLTGFGGFQRNLAPAEITGQAIHIRRHLMAAEEPLHHLVFMGMGEPMHNLEGVASAIRVLTDPDGFGMSRRRITVSTVGHVEGLERFGAMNLGVNLAVSLNATDDETRTRIMPINKRWPIAALLAALERYPLEQRRRITIEYVLMRGVNDTAEDAHRLTRLLRPLRCKVNLIMFNPHPLLPYQPVEPATLDSFATVLSRAHMTVTVRWSKGREIEAACGQLAAHHFEKQTA